MECALMLFLQWFYDVTFNKHISIMHLNKVELLMCVITLSRPCLTAIVGTVHLCRFQDLLAYVH